MHLNTLLNTGLIVTLVISLVCSIKRKNKFLKCRIPAGRPIGSARYVPFSLLYFWYPKSLLLPTRSAVGSNPTRLCGFFHALVTVSGKHGSEGSTLAIFLLFYVW